MTGATARSVTVRLNAEVAKYVADMKMAGKATQDAFRGVDMAVTRADRHIQTTTASMRNLGTQTRLSSPALRGLSRDVDGLGTGLRRTGADIDRLSGHLGLLAKLGAVVGPGLLPAGAVGAAGLAGLASQLGLAVVGMGSLVAASQGVGDALEAVNDASLDPTVENIEKAREAMSRLAPAAQAFVARFQQIRPVLGDIRDAAADGWFPGLTAALGDFERIAPWVADLFGEIGERGGRLLAEGAEAFAGPEWEDFRAFVSTEAPDALEILGRSVGNVAAGFGELWMAFSPLNRDFSAWVLDASMAFNQWASSLSQTEGFREFIEYVRTNGPKVADMAGAFAEALIQIAQAAAPLGGPVLDTFTAIARAIAAIADSPIGTPIMAMVTALSAMSLAARAAAAAQNALNGALARTRGAAGTGIAAYGRHAAVLGWLALSASGAADSLGLTNTMSMALMGTMAGPWGTAIGGAIGLTMDIVSANRSWEDSIRAVEVAMASGSASMMRAELAQQRQLLDELTAMEDPDSFWEMSGNLPTMTSWWLTGAPDVEDRIAATAGRIEKLEAALRGSGDAAGDAAGDYQGFTGTVYGALLWQRKLQAQLQATREALRQSSDAFLDFSDAIAGDKFSLDKYLDALEKQVGALANWRDNLDTLRDRGLAKGVLNELIRQGPAAAQAVEGLANSTDASIERMNRAFRSGRRERRGVTEDAIEATKAVEELGNTPANPTIDADSKPFRREKTAVDQLIDDLSGRTATSTIRANDLASGVIAGVLAGLGRVDGYHATSTITTVHRQVFSIERRGGAGQHSPGNSLPTPSADGSLWDDGVRRFAAGGFGRSGRYYDRVPMIVRGGANILWGEAETGWEAYISGKPGMRDRNLAILSEAAERLGVTVADLHSVRSRHSSNAHLHRGGGAGRTVRHVLDVRVTGEMDLERAKAQLVGIAREVAAEEIEFDADWRTGQELD